MRETGMFLIDGRLAAVLAALVVAAAGVVLIGGEPFASCERAAEATAQVVAGPPRAAEG
jgi:hypothetical protein